MFTAKTRLDIVEKQGEAIDEILMKRRINRERVNQANKQGTATTMK